MKLLIILLFVSSTAFAQSGKVAVNQEILRYDISPLFTRTANTAVVGYIGKEFQRIRVRFISVVKNPDQSDQYFVYGKSMVMDNVCEFQGVLKITSGDYLKDPDVTDVKQGQIKGDYSLFENATQKHVGIFRGTFSISFYINKECQIQYDDLMGDADGFSNNQFTGTWSPYNSTKSKPCNWGDYRIPASGDLDTGAGEFIPNDKYLNNGWSSYRTAYYGEEGPKTDEARKNEEREWWK